MNQRMLAIWSLVPLPFLNPAWTSGSSWFMYCWSLAWRILSITLPACESEGIVQKSEHSLALPFLGTGMKTDLFQSSGHCWGFQICRHIECSTFTASSFRIWNSSTGIPSPPLALFIVMLHKPHLSSHSRMSGSRWWSHHHDYLGHLDHFLYSSSVYSCHLFLISSASVRSTEYLSFIEPIFAWNSGFPDSSDSKASARNPGDLGLIPRLGRYPGEGNGNSLHSSCLGNPMDREPWQVTVRGVTKSQTQLSNQHYYY